MFVCIFPGLKPGVIQIHPHSGMFYNDNKTRKIIIYLNTSILLF
jgi:hypothetical protein